MKLNIAYRNLIGVGTAALVLGVSGVAAAVPTTGSTPVNGSASTKNEAQHLQKLQSRANAEIERRLSKLDKLNSLISSTSKLSSSDKATLTAEVNSAISGLTSLKSKIDADTDLTSALIDAKSVVTEYRVYVLVVPKVHIIAAADAQQNVEAKLSAFATKLQSRITEAKNKGKDVSELQTALDSMNQQITAAQGISTSVESKVLPLQPTDYNSDHTLLSGYRSQLVTAHNDDKAAYQDAKTIVQDLQKL
jgi:hypothetical protein